MCGLLEERKMDEAKFCTGVRDDEWYYRDYEYIGPRNLYGYMSSCQLGNNKRLAVKSD
jgi:hypothetical protein